VISLAHIQVTYINALASLSGAHEVMYERRGVAHTVTAKHILIAAGGRPVYPLDVPGAAEYGITSDDIFSLEKPPGNVQDFSHLYNISDSARSVDSGVLHA
jgi:thioredoxin reductase (NADPH)